MTAPRSLLAFVSMSLCVLACSGPRSRVRQDASGHASPNGAHRDAGARRRPPAPRELVLAALGSALPALPLPESAAEPRAPTNARPEPSEQPESLDTRAGYARFERGPFVVFAQEDELRVLAPYLGPLLDRAQASLSARYGVALAAPIRIDLYDDVAAYRARVAHGGLEGDTEGAYGDGRVIVLSPRGGARTWAQTLWHEIAHAVQALATRGRPMPRWIAEGLAERDALLERSEWRRDADTEVAALIARPDDTMAATLERTIATGGGREAGAAYFVATTLVGCLVAPSGDASVRMLTSAYASGRRDTDAIGVVSGMSIEALVSTCLAPLRRNALPSLASHAPPSAPGSAEALADLAALALVARRIDEARAFADASLAKAESARALYIRARIALEARDIAAETYLDRMITLGHDVFEVRIALGRAALARDDTATALRHATRAVALDGRRIEARDLELRLADEGVRSIDRDAALRALVDIDEGAVDLALRVVSSAAERDDAATVVTYGERLVYVAPGRPELHRRLADAYVRLGDSAKAAREREVLAALGERSPNDP